ncbi:MAG: ATP-binding protein, partial [Candidatus Acidiferrum sp.]
ILDNALKYTPSGGSVEMRAFANAEEGVIEIEDTGVGIAADDLPRIFDRFYRADQARSREVPGSGLGLSIARWIAETHKGRIEVESRLGEGSVFRIVIPLLSADAGAQLDNGQLLDSQASVL